MSPVLIPEFTKLALGDDIVEAAPDAALIVSVSYTHLTLPTSDLV